MFCFMEWGEEEGNFESVRLRARGTFFSEENVQFYGMGQPSGVILKV